MSALVLSHDSVNTARRDELPEAERHEMFQLLSAHFTGVSRVQFDRDFEDKDWVLRLRREGRLIGFSTLKVYPTLTDHGPAHVFYSGDTIVAPEGWDSPTLARGWIGLVKRIQQVVGPGPHYWLLLSSGFRTYRFLPVFWRNFWPRYDQATPPAADCLLRSLARAQFGDAFDAARGIVRFVSPQQLRPALAAVPKGRDRDPHIRFFLEKNPGCTEGDELVCLTELSDQNLTSAGVRIARNAL